MSNVENIMNNCPSFRLFKYWFSREWSDDPLNNIFNVLDRNTGELLYSNIDFDHYDPKVYTEEVYSDFELYKTRPEYQIGLPVDLSDKTKDNLVMIYESLITGINMIRRFKHKQDPDDITRTIQTCNWLESGDFYSAPASTRFHDAYESGLLLHTLNVYNECCKLWHLDKFNSVNCDSFALVTLVHDWCKIGLYESYMRNVKDESTGTWNQVKSYKWSDKGPAFPFGHGATSMFLVSRFFSLTVEESLAIRWHMGWCNVADNESSDLQSANERYPLVHLVQFADQLSIVSY